MDNVISTFSVSLCTSSTFPGQQLLSTFEAIISPEETTPFAEENGKPSIPLLTFQVQSLGEVKMRNFDFSLGFLKSRLI